VCFVCLGNICRSPTAAGIMRRRLEEAGLAGVVEVESAGTGDWHVGHGADPRSAAEAERRGLSLAGHRARRFTRADFGRFDLVLAMDADNLEALRAIAPDASSRDRVRLLRSFDPGSAADDRDVPDPYHGGPEGFRRVFDQVDAACRGLVAHLRRG
jgi:protein-tyrosine phosphatase